MSSPYPDYPRSPQYPQAPAPYPPAPAQPAPDGPYPVYQAPYPVPPGTPQQMSPPAYGQAYQQARPRPTDAYAWCMGLLVFVLIPGLGSVVASIAMIVVGLRCRRRPEPARTNCTAAASWGINYLLATLIFPGGFFLTLIEVLPADSGGFFPWGALGVAWLVLSLFHVIICIAFGVRAGRGKVVPFRGIPFIK